MQPEEIFDGSLPSVDVKEGSLSIVACVYNEALRLPDFLHHHRAIGVSHFFIVDNHSSDGTADILRQSPDVIYLSSKHPFKGYRKQWIKTIADTYLANRWALFLDADELFVFDGWPGRTALDLTASLEENEEQILFCSMVEMYSDLPLKKIQYNPGEPLLTCCPYFDSDNYYILRRIGQKRDFPTPTHHLYGGPRDRLFSPPRRALNAFEKWALNRFFGIHRLWTYGRIERFFIRQFRYVFRKAVPQPWVVMSKVPLVKWQREYAYQRGPHNMNRILKMSAEWGALLHFKYLQDFTDKVQENIKREQHAENSRYYKAMLPRMEHWLNNSPLYEGSKRLEKIDSLKSSGLIKSR